MPKVQAITTCRECGAPRDPAFKLALCTEHAKEWRATQNAKHHATSKPRSQRIAEAYERLNVRGLIDAIRKGAAPPVNGSQFVDTIERTFYNMDVVSHHETNAPAPLATAEGVSQTLEAS